MSIALGMNMGALYGNRCYQGWYGEKPAGMLNYENIDPQVKNPYNYFSLYEWEKLRDGDNLLQALDHATQEVQKLPYDGDKAMNDVRVRGQGNIWEFKIE